MALVAFCVVCHAAFLAAGLAGACLLVPLYVAALVAAWRARSPTWLAAFDEPAAPWLAFVVLVLLRVAIGYNLPGPQVSDFLEYHDLAVRLLQGAPWLGDGRPMGYSLLLAACYAACGVQWWVGVGLNVVLAAATGGLLYAWVARVATPVAGTIALTLYALNPAQALMVPAQGSEIPYACLVAAATLTLARLDRSPLGLAGLTGLLLGLSQYVRPTSLLLVPAALVACWAWRESLGTRRLVGAVATLLLGFGIALAPVARYNWQAHQQLSLSTSSYGAWSSYVGLNADSNGAWNEPDALWYFALPEATREETTRAAARDRLTANPVALPWLFARKAVLMWCVEDYGAFWTLGLRPGPRSLSERLLELLSQAIYFPTLALAWLALRLRRPTPSEVFVLAALALLAAAHCFVEIQSRYHFYFVPLLIGLAAIGLERALRDRAHS